LGRGERVLTVVTRIGEKEKPGRGGFAPEGLCHGIAVKIDLGRGGLLREDSKREGHEILTGTISKVRLRRARKDISSHTTGRCRGEW